METTEIIAALRVAATVDPHQGRGGPEVVVDKKLCAEAADRLEELTRPGRWIYYRDDQNRLWCKCSLCLKTYGCLDTSFCPNCGHPMIGEDLE